VAMRIWRSACKWSYSICRSGRQEGLFSILAGGYTVEEVAGSALRTSLWYGFLGGRRAGLMYRASLALCRWHPAPLYFIQVVWSGAHSRALVVRWRLFHSTSISSGRRTCSSYEDMVRWLPCICSRVPRAAHVSSPGISRTSTEPILSWLRP
jgi:hypothetical protein